MTTPDTFLSDATGTEIDWVKPAGAPVALQTEFVQIGSGPDGFEVAFARTIAPTVAPKADEVRALWKVRWNRRAAPVALVVAHQDLAGAWKASVCGTKEDPAVITGLPLDQVERICLAALEMPDPANAERTLHSLLTGQKDGLVAGLKNVGLFASHELRTGVPARADFAAAGEQVAGLLGSRGQDLIRGLGYSMTPHGSIANILSVGGANRAVAVLLDDAEMFDRVSDRFNATSPVARGMAIAAEQNLPWLIITKGTQIRLYPTSPDVGVGRKGQAETYAEVNVAMLPTAQAGYLHLIFSASALAENGTASEILAASVDHATGLGERLRTRVYEDVVPALAVAVANEMGATTEKDLDEAYHRTLTILFRLLFVAYAEDRALLPYLRNPRYTRKALKTLAREFTETEDLVFDEGATDRWEDLLAVWKAVDDGNTEWDVPAYNGGLFAADEHHPTGQAIAAMTLTNAQIGPALRALLIDTGADGTLGPVDFRSLTVREFGTIYEGLLESSLSVAPMDLGVDNKTKAYIPHNGTGEPKVPAGQVYFHNASGARKATGSYFTKKFAVEHLLDTALEPALTAHLARVQGLLNAGDDVGASDAFFDFRVADLAMGSGHFLVAAIDRIENRLSAFLATHTITGVSEELARLSVAARDALGPNSAHIEIEPSGLLRRQIARRCIYGLDLNLMAVELARLGIWIHTFVPGLPMSSLDHGLLCGNSLTGIATVEEVLTILEPRSSTGQYSLIGDKLETELGAARDRLVRAARTAEATKREVREASREHAKAMTDAADAKALLDAAIAVRLGIIPLPFAVHDIIAAGKSKVVRDKMTELGATHLPYRFPEVFLRDNPGFDVFLGNPPWEKVHVEEHNFWTIRFPGLMSLPEDEMNVQIAQHRAERPDLVTEYETESAQSDTIRDAILRTGYPGIGAGHVDLFQVFCWRTWLLLRQNGRAGIVLPRGATSGSGAAKWREDVIRHGAFQDVTFLSNDKWWVFDGADNRMRCSLTTYAKGGPDTGTIRFRGPYRDMAQYQARTEGLRYNADEFASWSQSNIIPLLPSADGASVFAKLRAHPRFDATDGFSFRPVQGDFNGSGDKALWKKTEFPGALPVLAGASFNTWDPNYGSAYGWASPGQIRKVIKDKRAKQIRSPRAAYFEMTLPDATALPARIAWRDRTNMTNTRSTLVALMPPETILVHNAPLLVRRAGTEQDEAYLLGVMASRPFDWYIRL